jgi:hypothetical protein
MRSRWSAVIPVAALVAAGSIVGLQRAGGDRSDVPVRPQTARESFILPGHGAPAPLTETEREDRSALTPRSRSATP